MECQHVTLPSSSCVCVCMCVSACNTAKTGMAEGGVATAARHVRALGAWRAAQCICAQSDPSTALPCDLNLSDVLPSSCFERPVAERPRDLAKRCRALPVNYADPADRGRVHPSPPTQISARKGGSWAFGPWGSKKGLHTTAGDATAIRAGDTLLIIKRRSRLRRF